MGLPPAPRVARAQSEPRARSAELVAPAERAGPAVLVEWVGRVELPATCRPAPLAAVPAVDPPRLVATPALRRAVRRRVVARAAARRLVTRLVVLARLPAEAPDPARAVRLLLRVGRPVPVRAELVEPPRVVRVAWLLAVRAVRLARATVVTVARPIPAAPREVRAPRVRAVTAVTPTVASLSPRLSP